MAVCSIGFVTEGVGLFELKEQFMMLLHLYTHLCVFYSYRVAQFEMF